MNHHEGHEEKKEVISKNKDALTKTGIKRIIDEEMKWLRTLGKHRIKISPVEMTHQLIKRLG